MAENNVALSQSEIDKLLGKNFNYEEKNVKPAETIRKRSAVKEIASAQQLESVKDRMKQIIDSFRGALKESFDESDSRKINITNVELINAEDFENELLYPNFIYKIECKSGIIFIKLDNHLFCALANVSFDRTLKPNKFQAVVLQEEVVPLLVSALLENLSSDDDSVNITLIEDNKLKECPEIKSNDTGVLVSINWNENFKSFGVEKIYFCKEMYKNI